MKKPKKGPASKHKKARKLAVERRSPCPVCGQTQFWRIEDQHSSCPVCGWTHNLFQEANPDSSNMENTKSLNEAKAAFQKAHLYQCPCCGFYTLDGFYDSYDICPVCFWEEDYLQFMNPIMDGGANTDSLIQARITFKETGASEERFVEHVRPPLDNELHGIDYYPPKAWFDEANDTLSIKYDRINTDGVYSHYEELNWRKECYLPINGTENPSRLKPLSFRETIRKLSTYEIKKAIFTRLSFEDFDFIQHRMDLNKLQLQDLSDDEMNEFWEALSQMADTENEDKNRAYEIREKLQFWAKPCWDIPEWMTKW